MSNENHQKIQHLYWRAGFGLSPGEWLEKRNVPIENEVENLLRNADNAKEIDISVPKAKDSFVRNRRKLLERKDAGRDELIKMGRDARTEVLNSWIQRMVSSSEHALMEKMCLFWHWHFACINKEALLIENQLQTFRQHGLGNFRDLVIAVSRDSAMIKFLNTNLNKKNHPNENYARELLELFTIGIGNYSEKDIKEAARAFTGWNYDQNGEFRFIRKQHDYGQKRFLGRSGNFDGTDIIDIILENRQTAHYIASKFYRFFVNEKIDETHVNRLADVFYNSGYDIKRMVEATLKSAWFYKETNIGTKIKSPIGLIIGLMKTLDTNLLSNPQILVFLQRFLGQELYRPPGVKGWETGKAWITNSTLFFRLNLLLFLLNEKKSSMNTKEVSEEKNFEKNLNRFRRVTVDFSTLNAFLKEKNVTSELSEYLLSVKIDTDQIQRKHRSIDQSAIESIARRLMTSPEYQLC